jgi:hypothetical protein
MRIRIQKMLDLTSSTQGRTVPEKNWNSGPRPGPEARKNKILGPSLNESAAPYWSHSFSVRSLTTYPISDEILLTEKLSVLLYNIR